MVVVVKKKTIAFLVCMINAVYGCANPTKVTQDLQEMYNFYCTESTDIRGHVPRLRALAKECSSVAEIGIRSMVSSWGILQGLAESSAEKRAYLGIDLMLPPEDMLNKAQMVSMRNNIQYTFLQANDMEISIDPVDMLFIDSLHTYCHLTYELEAFSPVVKKYIAMHDTSDPWGALDDNQYNGDYSEYPVEYDRNKRGLWAAVEDFLSRHPEWELSERYFDYHGFTVLKRVGY